MKKTVVVLLSLAIAAPLFASAGERLIPAGSLISCTVAEPRISSKTTAVGDPVLCHMGLSERYGRSVLPQDSYLLGRFEDYKDPGHFVGKGWMELKFDRMVIEPNTILPVDVRVVDVPGYKVDNQGRILGKGHAVRDIVTWTIPILWPLDLLLLPARGPRPTLKEETRLTVKVMDDLSLPATEPMQRDPYGLIPRGATAENELPPPQAEEPVARNNAPPPPPMNCGYSAPPPQVYYLYPAFPPQPVYYIYPAFPPPPVYYVYPGFPPPPVFGYAGPPAVRYGYGSRSAYGMPMERAYGYGAAARAPYGGVRAVGRGR